MISAATLREKYGAEIAAVILIFRVFFKTADDAELSAFLSQNKLDWDLFYKIVAAHRIRPMVNRVLVNHRTGGEIIKVLQTDCTYIALRNFQHFRETVKLCGLFMQAGIQVVPYKGVIFGARFYGDLSMRESSDMDFLMRPDRNDLGSLAQIFAKLGYQNASEVPAEFSEFYFTLVREFKFVRYEDGKRKFLAEFHSALNDPVFETEHPVTNAYLFEGLGEVAVNSQHIRALSAEKEVIAIISHHGIREQWTSFKNLADLVMAMRSSEQVDWAHIITLSREHRFHNVLITGLQMADDLFGVGLPQAANEARDISLWHDKLFTAHLHGTGRTWRYNFSLKLASKDTTGDKIRMLLKHAGYAFQPTLPDYRFVKLPRALFPLYVFIKPFRKLFGKQEN